MALKDMYDFSGIENEAVKLVIDELERQLPDTIKENPDNEEYILDVATFALNNIKPAYSVTLLGKMYANSLEESDYAKQVAQMVKNAIKKIKPS